MRAHDIDRMMSVHVAYVAMWGVKLICGMWHAACGMWHARTFIVFWQGMCVQGVCAGRMCRACVQGVCARRVWRECVQGACGPANEHTSVRQKPLSPLMLAAMRSSETDLSQAQ